MSNAHGQDVAGKKFLVDIMLIKLGRWLRILGYDCKIPNAKETDDDDLLDIAEKENRILITMDKSLSERKAGAIIIYIPSRMNSAKLQLEFLMKNNHINRSFLGRDVESKIEEAIRCSECGHELLEVDKEELKALNLPEKDEKKGKSVSIEKLVSSHDKFWVCKKCHHIYWKGSHWRKIIEFLSSLEVDQ